MSDWRPKNLFDLRNQSTVRNQSRDQWSKPDVELEAVRAKKTQAKLDTDTLIDACLKESWHEIPLHN